jgi:HK97 family phage portal protein
VGWLHRAESKDLPNIISVDPFGVAFGGRPNGDGMLFPDSSYETYARNGFGRNELVYACIMEKARCFPQGVLRVYPDGPSDRRNEPLDDHRLRRLIAQPNPVTNEVEFGQLSIVYLDLSGNCYWLIIRGRDGVPAELWPIRPDLIRILPSARDPRVWAYGYVPDPTSGLSSTATVIPVPRSDMVHIKYPNPLDMYFGQAPLRPATRAVTVDNARTDFVDALLRNDAVPRVVIKTAQEIDEKVTDRLEERWMRKFGGRNRGRPAFLQTGMDVQVLGLNLDELQFGDMSGITEARICAAMGVQPILVGAKVGLDRSTFANFKEAKAAFWETTLMDLQRLWFGGISTQVLPFFLGVGRQRVALRWDNSDVLALQEAETDKWERATNALSRGGITQNDFRRVVGLDPVPGGDVFLIGAGVTPTPAFPDQQPAAAPANGDQGDNGNQGDTGPEADPNMPMTEAASYGRWFLDQRPVRRNGSRALAVQGGRQGGGPR